MERSNRVDEKALACCAPFVLPSSYSYPFQRCIRFPTCRWITPLCFPSRLFNTFCLHWRLVGRSFVGPTTVPSRDTEDVAEAPPPDDDAARDAARCCCCCCCCCSSLHQVSQGPPSEQRKEGAFHHVAAAACGARLRQYVLGCAHEVVQSAQQMVRTHCIWHLLLPLLPLLPLLLLLCLLLRAPGGYRSQLGGSPVVVYLCCALVMLRP